MTRERSVEIERQSAGIVGEKLVSSRGGVDFTPGIFFFFPLVCVTDNSKALSSKAREGEFAGRPLFFPAFHYFWS